MPEVLSTGRDVYSVAFTEDEAKVLEAISTYFHVSPEQALIDQITLQLERSREALELSGTGSLFKDLEAKLPSVLAVRIPEGIPVSSFDLADWQFLEASLAIALRDNLTVVLYKRLMKGSSNVVGREDEGNGTSVPVVP